MFSPQQAFHIAVWLVNLEIILLSSGDFKIHVCNEDVKHSLDFTLAKAVHLVNADLVNNLANLISRSTANSINPKQKYPSFDLEVMEHVLKGTGEKIVLMLNELAG